MLYSELLKVINHGNAIENLKDSGITVTLSGIMIVFSMLVLLVVILVIFGIIMKSLSSGDKKVKKVKEPKVEKKTVAKNLPVVSTTSASADESDDIIAAISAAVMMMYEGTGKTPVIRSIRPAQKGIRSAWANAGVLNNTRSF